MQNEIHPELLLLLRKFKESKAKLETAQGQSQLFAAQLAMSHDAIILSNALEQLIELHLETLPIEEKEKEVMRINVSNQLSFAHIAKYFVESIGAPVFLTLEHEGNALVSAIEVAMYGVLTVDEKIWSDHKNSLVADKVLAYAAASLNDAQGVSAEYVERMATRVREQLRTLPPFIYGLKRDHEPRYGNSWFDDRERLWSELHEILGVELHEPSNHMIKGRLKLIVAQSPSQSFMNELESNFEHIDIFELNVDRVRTLNSSTVEQIKSFIQGDDLVACVLGGMKHKVTHILKSSGGHVRYLNGSLHSAQALVKEVLAKGVES